MLFRNDVEVKSWLPHFSRFQSLGGHPVDLSPSACQIVISSPSCKCKKIARRGTSAALNVGMKRFLILLCIFGPSVAIAISVSAVRSIQASQRRAKVDHGTGVVIVPAGTLVLIRLVGGLSNAAQSGDLRQAITADPTLSGTQTLIPRETLARVRILSLEKQSGGKVVATLQLQNLISKDHIIPIHSDIITAELNRASDFAVIKRAASGLIGGAIGASTSGIVKNDPRLGAAAIAGMAAGMGTEDKADDTLVFQVLDPIDLTGIRW